MPEEPVKKSSKLFIGAFIAFLSVMIFFVADMASRTTAPWNKPKKVEAPADSLLPDSLFRTDSL